MSQITKTTHIQFQFLLCITIPLKKSSAKHVRLLPTKKVVCFVNRIRFYVITLGQRSIDFDTTADHSICGKNSHGQPAFLPYITYIM